MARFDFFRGVFDRKSTPPTEAGGVPGTAIFGGFIERREESPKLADNFDRYKTFSDLITNVSIVAAGVRFFLNLVAKAGWKVEPADDSPLAAEIAEFIDFALHDMATPWTRVVRITAAYRLYGFSVQEWIAKRNDDGRIGLRDIQARPQYTIEKWDTEEDGSVIGVMQRSPQTGEELYLERGKLLYAVDDSLSDSPEGLGLLRHLVEPSIRLRRFEQLEGFGYETDLRGIPFGKAPIAELNKLVKAGTITSAQAKEALAPIQTFIQKHIQTPSLGLVLDSSTYLSEDEAARPSNVPQWDLNLLSSSGGTSLDAAARTIERINREMARILGVEHLLLGGDGKGSLALSRDKTQNFGLIIDSTLTELEWVMQRDVVRVLVMLNGWPEELTPRLKTEQVQYRDVEQITQAIRDLADSGAPLMPGDPVVDEIRDLLGLSKVPQELMDAMVEAAMIGAQERERMRAGGVRPDEAASSGSGTPDEDETPETREEEGDDE